jgi:hypothetical protein
MIGIALLGRQRIVDRQAIFSDEMRDDRIAVADILVAIEDVGQLATRRRFRIKDMLMAKGQVAQLQEGENLQHIRIVIGNAVEFRVGIEGDHASSPRMDGHSINAQATIGRRTARRKR